MKKTDKPNAFQLFSRILPAFFILTVFAASGWGQGTESFDNLNAPTGSYGLDGSFIGNNGIEWSYNEVRKVTDATYYITDPSAGFPNSGDRHIQATIAGGISSLEYKTRSYFTGGDETDRTIRVLVNGDEVDNYTLEAMGTVYTRIIDNIDVGGTFTLRFESTGTRQIIIDDIEWTGFVPEGDVPPSLGLVNITDIGAFTAQFGGEVTSDGGATVTARGFVYAETATNADPIIDGAGVTQVPSDDGTGVFSKSISGLTPGTNYSVKAYAENAEGVSYSTVATFNTLVALGAAPYTEGFDGFVSEETLPVGWTVSDDVYNGDWGSGTSAGLRGNDNVLGYQHTGTTGVFVATLTLVNNTGEPIEALDVSYLGRVERADETRHPVWTVFVNGAEVSALSYSTAVGVDELRSAIISGLNIANGEIFTIEWSSDGNVGSAGSRRQIGIGDVSVEATEPPVTEVPFETKFGTEDNWDLITAAGTYGEKAYEEGGWYFHSTHAVRAPGEYKELYNGSAYSFRERGVFTVYNQAPLSGMTGFSFQFRHWMSSPGYDRDFRISLDGGLTWGTIETINRDWFSVDFDGDYEEYVYYFSETKDFDAEEFVIEILGGGDNNQGRINIGQFKALDEIPPPPPALPDPEFDPSAGTYFEDQTVFISNFSDYDPTVTVYYTTDGNDPDDQSDVYDDNDGIELLDGNGPITLKAIAIDGTEASDITSGVYTFPKNVDDIAELRSGETDGTIYKLTEEVVLTFQSTFRNHKYIQDATGAIKIDDDDGIITTEYDLYDGIEGIVGTLTTFNNMLRFVPLADPGNANSSDNVLIPEVISLDDLDSENQAQLVQILNVFIDTTDDINFVAGKDYPIEDDDENEGILRTRYNDVDYIGTEIPLGPVNLVGVVRQFHGTTQIIPRSLADFEELPMLSVNVTAIDELFYVDGDGPSDSQLFEVSGKNLDPEDGTITISATGTDYEVSLDDATFDETAKINYTDGGFDDEEIFVRLKEGLAAGSYDGQELEITGGNAATVKITLNGDVFPTPATLGDEGYTENFDGFTGSGFSPNPAAGQLHSGNWRITGMDDGDGTFGGIHITGDFARGSSIGGETTGGTYAFDVGVGVTILGVQPTGSDFTPGEITLKLENTTGETIENIAVSYDIYVYNDQNRSSSFNFAYSSDDGTYTHIPAMDYTTPEAADASPKWVKTERSTVITDLNIAEGDFIYLQWQSNDVGGSGSRDEFGLTNVVVEARDIDVDMPVFSLGTGTYYEDQTITITNYDAYDAGTKVFYTTDGSTPDKDDSDEYDDTEGITLLDGNGAITLKAIAIDQDDFESPLAEATYTFPVNVADIEALRAQATGPTIYRVTNEATFIGGTSFRNTKFFQDDSGFGIQIDDPNPAIITSTYNIGDNVSELVGTLGSFQGQLQLSPVQDPGDPVSTGNDIAPIEKTLDELGFDDQSRLVVVKSVVFQNAGGIFGGGGSRTPIKDPSIDDFSGSFKNVIGESDISGSEIPSTGVNIIGFVQQDNVGLNLVSRSLDDFTELPVFNETTGTYYLTLQDAVDDAEPGDRIVFAGNHESLNASESGVILAPGASPGCAIFTSTFTISATETLQIEINGPVKCTQHDQIEVGTIATLNDANLEVFLGFAPSLGDKFVIMTYGSLVGEFVQGNEVSDNHDGFNYTFSIDYSTGDEITLIVTHIGDPTAIPIAPWAVFLLFGLMGAFVIRKIRR